MSQPFSLPGLTLAKSQIETLASDGIAEPTSVQTLAFEPIASGQHVLVDSGTGTGKTLAYLLPLLQKLQNDPAARVVCISPSAELCVQILGVANRYKNPDLSTAALVGGGNQKKQKDRIQKTTRLIVGTPGRILEMIANRKLKGVTTYVLDEPEPVLSSKDANFLVEVFTRPPRPQIILVGATFGRGSARVVEDLMSENLASVRTEENPLVSRIEHFRKRVRDAGDRDLQLARFLERQNRNQAIVYVNQAHLIRHVYRYLCDSGITVETLSSERTKQQCQRALRLFRNGEVQALLTTDRAATGVDVPSVPWVVHYEPPRSPQAYVHRAGRSGRAGKRGSTLSLIEERERFILRDLESELGISIEPLDRRP